ncbi:MAG: transcriptional regulator [Ponticaulis sp.]|nr:transcriptional regulator [Ponticaulis sp.]
MKEGPDLSRIAALIGDPARANMLMALMSGKALTPSELSVETGLTKQTVSSHLSRLQDGGLIAAEKQGRHRYVRLAGEDVAAALEGLMALSAEKTVPRVRTGPKDAAMRKARVCYDHLAGEMGVWMFDRLADHAWLKLGADSLELTSEGWKNLTERAVPLGQINHKKRPLCRTCLDWSERRSHLAGSLGAILLEQILTRNWARREANSRVIAFSPEGEMRFRKWLG